MIHTPLPARIAVKQQEKTMPAAIGIILAMGGSVALWAAIYAACIWRF